MTEEKCDWLMVCEIIIPAISVVRSATIGTTYYKDVH